MEMSISLQWPGERRGPNCSRAGLERDFRVEAEAHGELDGDQEESGSITSVTPIRQLEIKSPFGFLFLRLSKASSLRTDFLPYAPVP